jgi:hypothetical protein
LRVRAFLSAKQEIDIRKDESGTAVGEALDALAAGSFL